MTLVEMVILASAVLALFIAFIAMNDGDRLRKELKERDARLKTLQQDMRSLCNAAVTMGERMGRQERNMQRLDEKQEQLGVRQERMASGGEGEERSFEQAIRMARRGSSVEELMSMFSLTRGEAELIAMMHRLEPQA